MRTFHGLTALLDAHDELPDLGFLHTVASDDVDSLDGLEAATFLMWESEEEELFLESSTWHRPWLEAPTLVDVINSFLELHETASPTDASPAVLHHWVHDDFMG
ncbi:MAG: hypothetical protein Q4D89_10895 [Arachnia propionica]|uniref:hypothetical protein n=1 Tax=Arachnia propionica TaxID=1750 RepID=UPI002706AA87|nr:hypothetical protein [Arachnia propionica]